MKTRYLLMIVMILILVTACEFNNEQVTEALLTEEASPVIQMNVKHNYVPNAGFDGVMSSLSSDSSLGKYIYFYMDLYKYFGPYNVDESTSDFIDQLQEGPNTWIYDLSSKNNLPLAWYPGDMYGASTAYFYDVYEEEIAAENLEACILEKDACYGQVSSFCSDERVQCMENCGFLPIDPEICKSNCGDEFATCKSQGEQF